MADWGRGAVERLMSSGVVAAATVAGLQQLTRRLMYDAPRLDVLGERLIEKAFARFGRKPPESARALSWVLGNVGSDTLLFALVGAGAPRRPFVRGALVGAVTGVAALVVPPALGISTKYTARTWRTALTTVGLYVAAGLSAAGATRVAQQLETA